MLWQWRPMARLAAFSLVATSSVVAETRSEIGVLTCALGEPKAPSESATTLSVRNVLCWFRPFRNGPEETYRGTVAGAGQEREPFKRRVMIWLVRAPPTTQSAPGLLQQSYAAHPAASMDDACDTIIRALNTCGGRKDDVALLMARLNGIAPRDVAVWGFAAEPAEAGRVARKANFSCSSWT